MDATKGTGPREFSVTIGIDALRIAVGKQPKRHDIETICRWLRHMNDARTTKGQGNADHS